MAMLQPLLYSSYSSNVLNFPWQGKIEAAGAISRRRSLGSFPVSVSQTGCGGTGSHPWQKPFWSEPCVCVCVCVCAMTIVGHDFWTVLYLFCLPFKNMFDIVL